MSTLRIPNQILWETLENHLTSGRSERFAFALTRTVSNGIDGPVLSVEDIELIANDEVEQNHTGWTVKDVALDRVHNRAIIENKGLVEFHDHHIGPPGFSRLDESALEPMVKYVLDLLPGRPYGAAVLAEGRLHAEWFRSQDNAIQRGVYRSVTVVGDRLTLLNAYHDDLEERFTRQIPLLGRAGQTAARTLRVGVVGAGGTGSHAISLFSYLGVRDFVLLDDDLVETTNLNRLVTAELADVGAPKVLVARRRVLAVDPHACVRVFSGLSPDGEHEELIEVDLIISCVDNDGPRHRLNELAVRADIPLIDIGTGVDPNIDPPATGARVCFFLPGTPCLTCTEELDLLEVARWYKPSDQRTLDRAHGYGLPEASPSVVHLNGIAVNAAVAEVVAWISGARSPARRLDIDIDGAMSLPGVRVAPSSDTARRAGCIDCGWKYASDLEDGNHEAQESSNDGES